MPDIYNLPTFTDNHGRPCVVLAASADERSMRRLGISLARKALPNRAFEIGLRVLPGNPAQLVLQQSLWEEICHSDRFMWLAYCHGWADGYVDGNVDLGQGSLDMLRNTRQVAQCQLCGGRGMDSWAEPFSQSSAAVCPDCGGTGWKEKE